MNSEKQRIAIAESMGYTWWITPMNNAQRVLALSQEDANELKLGMWVYALTPDYLNDRNAMTGAIAKLPAHKHIQFGRNLHEIMGLSLIGYVPNYPNDYKQITTLLTAPLDLLAEAYLHTVGRWETLPPTTEP